MSLKHPISEPKAKEKRSTQKKKNWDKAKEKAEVLMKQLEGKYNGVIGRPPKWLPNPLQEEFHATRNFLLREYKPKIILQYMESRKKLLDFQGLGSVSSYPINRESNLDSLLYIQKIIELGKTEGIKAYLGESGQEVVRAIVHVERQKDLAKRPRTDALQSLIIKILGQFPEISFQKFLEELKKEIGKGTIETITENKIEWTGKNGKVGDTLFSALKARITRARKNFNYANRLT